MSMVKQKIENFNPFQPSVVFHIETNDLICYANQMAAFYMKCNTGLKWVKLKCFLVNRRNLNSFMTETR